MGNTKQEMETREIATPSKSQRKRNSTALQLLGERLARSTTSTLSKCNLPEQLLASILEYRRLPNKHGAERRQLQFIGKLMRELDDQTIESIHRQLNLNVELEKRRAHRIEELRDRLLAGDASTLTDALQAYQALEPKTLGQLVRQAKKELGQTDSPLHARKLHRYLREKLDS